jgi:putative lipoic acid-binding regulatory protein
MTGQITVIDKPALIVNKPTYISQSHTETTVWRQTKEGEFRKVKIQIGDVTKDQVEIINGLIEGDIIALKKYRGITCQRLSS